MREVSLVSAPVVSVIIPCRNEEKYIGNVVSQVIHQQGSGVDFRTEILVVDGMSTDSTISVLTELAKKNKSIRIIRNEKRITPAAFNLGIRHATGRFICILGSHAEIERDYILSCLEVIHCTAADNVGGPWKAEGKRFMGEAIALAFNNSVAVGGAKSHDLNYEGPVDSVWGGFYKREVFDTCGGFDEELVRNQDDEFNLRLIEKGLTIYQSPRIRFSYYCRDSLGKLFKQYFQYGFWKTRVMQKHRRIYKVRHIIPILFIASAGACVLMIPLHPVFLVLSGFAVASYILLLVGASVRACFPRQYRKYMSVMPLIMATYHFSYGIGEIFGLCALINRSSGRRR